MPPMNARDISQGLRNSKLTEEENARIEEIKDNPSLATADDTVLIEKYNNYVKYYNAESKRQYEAQVGVAQESGPASMFQRTEEYTEVGPIPPGEFVPPFLASETGALYDIFQGPTDPGAIGKDSTFLFTDDGVIPLSEEGQRLLQRYSIGSGTGLNVMFGLEGDETMIVNGTQMPIFHRKPGEELELPPGVVKGIPDGADKDNYISVGKVQNLDGSVGRGDPFLYVKIGEPATGEKTLTRNVGDPVPVYPSMPFEPEYIDTIDVPVENVEVPGRDPEGGDEPQEDPTYGYSGEPNPPDVREEEEKEKDPLFTANLLANIAHGLGNIDMSGVNIPVPTYDQPRYGGMELGPAVQNLYRGR